MTKAPGNAPLALGEPEREREVLDRAALGARIRALRTEAGWTQSELGMPEFSKAYISQIESGRTAPSLATLSVIAAKLGQSVATLLPDRDRCLADPEPLWRAAKRLWQHGERAAATDLVEQAARLTSTAADPKLRGRGRLRYARALHALGHREPALAECEEAIEALCSAGDPQLLGLAYALAGGICQDLGEWSAARRHLLRALRHFPMRSPEHSRTLIRLSRLFRRAGRLEDAARYARLAVDLAHTYGDGAHEALGRLALGFALIASGDPAAALPEADAAEAIVRCTGRTDLILRCRHCRALAAYRLDLPQARAEMRRVLHEALRAQERKIAAAIYCEIAERELRCGRKEAAARAAEAGIRHARAARVCSLEARLLTLDAEAELSLGVLEEGLRSLIRARDLYVGLGQGPAFGRAAKAIAQSAGAAGTLIEILAETPPPELEP